jgi:tetratricopeptide (TPR) repeat protein
MRILHHFRNSSGRILFFALLICGTAFLTVSCKTAKKTTSDAVPAKKISQEEQLQLTALFIDALREKSLGYYDKAYGLFSQCVKRNPQYAPALYQMAHIHNMKREYKEALVLALNASKIDPGNEWYQKLLADIYVSTRDYASAAKVIRQLLDRSPSKTELAYDLSNLYVLSGKYPEAIKVLDGVEKIYGIQEETSIQKEKLYLGMGRINKAIEELSKLSREFPAETRFMGMLAELYMTAGQPVRAFDIYNRILSFDPNDPFVHLSLSEYYREQNNLEKSFDELQLAFENPRLDIDTKIGILLRYFAFTETREEKKSQAYTLNEIVVRVHPEEAKGWSMYGDYLYRDNRLEEARDAFRTVTALDSSKYVVWAQLLAIQSALGNTTALRNESERTIRLFPEQAEPYLYNAMANLQLKDYNASAKSAKTGLQFAIDNAMIIKMMNCLAEASYHAGKYDDSFEAFEKILKMDPKNTFALNNYSYYLALQKQNLLRATELAGRLNELAPGNHTYQDTYGWVLFKQERFAESKTWIEKAIANGGNTNPVILEHYGDVLYKLNEVEKAWETWKKAQSAGGASEILLRKINDRKWYE